MNLDGIKIEFVKERGFEPAFFEKQCNSADSARIVADKKT